MSSASTSSISSSDTHTAPNAAAPVDARTDACAAPIAKLRNGPALGPGAGLQAQSVSPANPVNLRSVATQQARFFKYLTAALFLFTSWHAFMPNPGGGGLGQLDKLMHFAAFASLAFSGSLALPSTRRTLWRLAALLLAYGAFIEIVQIWIPGRDASWLDLLSDAAGTVSGLAAAAGLRRWGPLRQAG